MCAVVVLVLRECGRSCHRSRRTACWNLEGSALRGQHYLYESTVTEVWRSPGGVEVLAC
jgi:hypothetical protein